MRIVGDGCNVFVTEKIFDGIQNQRFTCTRTANKKWNDLPRIAFVDFKEKATEKRLNPTNDALDRLCILFELKLKLKNTMKERRWNILPVQRTQRKIRIDRIPMTIGTNFGDVLVCIRVVLARHDGSGRELGIVVGPELLRQSILEAIGKRMLMTIGLQIAKFWILAQQKLIRRLVNVVARQK